MNKYYYYQIEFSRDGELYTIMQLSCVKRHGYIREIIENMQATVPGSYVSRCIRSKTPLY